MTAVYFGAGTDLRPTKLLDNVTNYYYIDCQPFSEFGLKNCLLDGERENRFSRKYFIPELLQELSQYNFMELCSPNMDLKMYIKVNPKGETCILSYLINTSLPHHMDRIWKNVPKHFDYLIVSGHHPRKEVCDNLLTPITFVGFFGTCYHYEPEDKDSETVIDILHTDISWGKSKFHTYLYFDKNYTKYTFKT